MRIHRCTLALYVCMCTPSRVFVSEIIEAKQIKIITIACDGVYVRIHYAGVYTCVMHIIYFLCLNYI